MPPIPDLDSHSFTLDVSGIVGFLGGEEAISAMESVHFYEHRKFLGFYNTPGSYKVAKHYGKLARSQLWDALYPGPNEEPAAFLKMDGKRGPKYKGVMSGTSIDDIGHIGNIFAQLCSQVKPTAEVSAPPGKTPMAVTIVDFDKPVKGTPIEIPVTYPATVSSTPWRHIVTLGVIAFNIGACVVCGVFQEWYAFALILLGILCNGMACYLIGSATIYLKRHVPSQNSPPGNGILDDRDQFIVLRGKEEAVNYVVKGRFVVEFGSDTSYNTIGISAVALTIQFIAQLFLAPQAGLFGQILFLATLAVSWINNACLSSIDKEELQQKILKKHLPLRGEVGRKYMMGSRTSAVVFAMLSALPLDELKDRDERETCIRGILGSLLPTGTKVWNEWADVVVAKVRELEALLQSNEKDAFDAGSRKGLLGDLLNEANVAFEMFVEMRQSRPQSVDGVGELSVDGANQKR